MTKEHDIFAHGSGWIRADFHMHTRADKEFSYEGANDQFVATYVDALKNADIRIAAITNHNKFDLAEFKAIRKAARKKDVFLLPGVELSVKDGRKGIHTLVVFSDEWFDNTPQTNHIQNFLGLTFAGQDNFENENSQSNHDLHETIRKLDEYDKDYFLVFAHVEADNGLWGGFGGATIKKLAESDPFLRRCLGFQKVRTHDQRHKVQEWLGDWYPAEVEGCDCKSLEQVGQGLTCYLKVGDFTFEAVKFALLDYDNRLGNEMPKYDHSYIRSIAFEGDKLGRQVLHLSPELNTFIGIRGSGKSSIIESIRYALDIRFGKNAADRKYKEGSVDNALGSGGKITITAVDRHGREYEVRRILNEQPDVYVDGELQPGINIRETVIHKPIYFGQKDLSNTGEGFENDLVEKLVGEKLAEVRQEIALQRQKVSETTRRLAKLSDVADKQKEYEDKNRDAGFRLKVFKEHGVEEKLEKQIDFEEDSRRSKELGKFVTGYVQGLEDFIAEYEDEFVSRRRYASKRNKKFFDELFDVYDKIFNGFQRVAGTLNAAKSTSIALCAKANEFDAIKNALKEEFAEIARKLTEELKSSGATAIEPNEFLKLRKVIENARQMIKALNEEKQQQTALQTQLLTELTQLNERWHAEYKIIKQQLDRINEQETALHIDVKYKEDKEAFLKFIKDLFRGSKLRETTLKELVDEFTDGAAVYRDLEKAKALIGTSAPAFEEYFIDNLSAFLTWQVPNKFTIKFHGKQLKNHSIGQRASALILFVLSQRDNDVVIIDQPEDDLDNQTIYEDVIKLVRKLKCNTQFIFATHNANVPVLGDAEQIIACDYSEDSVNTRVGSIDCPALQAVVVRIMEGGSEAFERRKEIYQIWKHQNSWKSPRGARTAATNSRRT